MKDRAEQHTDFGVSYAPILQTFLLNSMSKLIR